jgi:hypothetical protein
MAFFVFNVGYLSYDHGRVGIISISFLSICIVFYISLSAFN